MSDRFEKKRGGFLDMAISVRKKAKTFLDEVDQESNTPRGSMFFADKGYASAQNRIELEKGNLTNGIIYKAVKGKELTGSEKLMNRVSSGLRGKIEKGFGTLKRNYGFSRTRYIGCAKVKLEFLLTAMAFNLKKAALMVR